MSSAEAEYVALSASCAKLADMFTKALPEDRFKYLVKRIALRQSNAVARRVVNDLIKLSGSADVSKYMLSSLLSRLLIPSVSLTAMKDQGKVSDSLMALRYDRRDENNKLLGVNELIGEALEQIAMKEGHLTRINDASSSGEVYNAYYEYENWVQLIYGGFRLFLSFRLCSSFSSKIVERDILVLEKQASKLGLFPCTCLCRRLVAEFDACYANFVDLYGYAIGVVFVTEPGHAIYGLVGKSCILVISLSKKRRLVAELEVMAEQGDKGKFLEHMREIVAQDAVTLGDLEKLLARAQVGVSLKDGYVAERKRSRLS
nr:hypothetical protein [Tanacetum cinerariifolium]